MSRQKSDDLQIVYKFTNLRKSAGKADRDCSRSAFLFFRDFEQILDRTAEYLRHTVHSQRSGGVDILDALLVILNHADADAAQLREAGLT